MSKLVVLLSIVLLCGACGPKEPELTAAEARATAKEAYIYGFPLVDNYRILYSYFVDVDNPEYKMPWNEISNTARVYTPEDKAIQTPNSDTPYSFVGADLRAEPLVFTVPDVEEGRYYSLQFIDLYTHNFAYIGSRATGNQRGTYLLAGPAWTGEKPAGVDGLIRCETELALIIYRTQLFGTQDDIKNVEEIQSGYKVQPLSRFLDGESSAPAPRIEFLPPLRAEDERTSPEFFDQLNFVLQFCPTHSSEAELMARFAKIGVGAGQTFEPGRFTSEIRQAIEDGRADAWAAYESTERELASGTITSGDITGSRESLKNNYLYRMAAAVQGIYGNSKEEAIYPAYLVDANGQKLDASVSKYELRFEAGQLPPVNAFWSITMYDGTRHLVANPLKRYLINSAMLPKLKRDKDGSITIYIQYASPGPGKQANWLPAPNGPFFVAMRLYWPKPEAYDGTWKTPKLSRV